MTRTSQFNFGSSPDSDPATVQSGRGMRSTKWHYSFVVFFKKVLTRKLRTLNRKLFSTLSEASSRKNANGMSTNRGPNVFTKVQVKLEALSHIFNLLC